MDEELIMEAAEKIRKYAREKYPHLSDADMSVVFKTVGGLFDNLIGMKSVAIMTQKYFENK